MIKHYLFIIALLVAGGTSARDLREKYREADAFRQKYGDLYFRGDVAPAWIEGTRHFWYSVKTPGGTEFMLVDADKREKKRAFDPVALARALGAARGVEVDPRRLPFPAITFEKGLEKIKFTAFGDTTYTYDLARRRVTAREAAREWPRRGEHWGKIDLEDGKAPVPSPDGSREAFIREGNLFVREIATNETRQLSHDGSAGEYYSSRIVWSPDSKKLVSCKYRPAWTRKLRTVVAAPPGRVQPSMEEIDYVKPGDALPVRLPVLFLPGEGRKVDVIFDDPAAQFSVENVRWHPGSGSFTFDYNRRGHQEYIVYKVTGDTARARALVTEKSPTFVHYNALSRHDLLESDELLWISERDGWRHLYLYDASSGAVKRQVTAGEWVVKRVLFADERRRHVYLVGCGRDAGEDPYLEKIYRVDIDTGDLLCLTPENGNHRVAFSGDRGYFTDNWSRVDLPPVTVLRRASDGVVVLELERADVGEAVAAGWRAPEVFHAKGRDGATDIWGVIVRPVDFDPGRKYPVIEYIYAGPHDSFVPKSFTIAPVDAALAQLGFIVVQIDGMGTANRSKKFHDVCWKNLKDAGFPDRVAWMKAAAAAHPEMDVERVGIYGCSAGGQSAMGAVLFHPDFYKVSVSACGCHDNRMDKIWWNEQWMGYPVGAEYEECSNVVNAHRLEGKLMLILGELDDNVDPSSTVQVVNALIKANKEFEYVLLPNQRHTMGGAYGERKRRDFFVRHLLHEETPGWNNAAGPL
ncbi:MAG: S9 family peptidase [Odoribacteraceae bacterium]|nr:S9 family peptidase [Odoribacteraceae bacterium]